MMMTAILVLLSLSPEPVKADTATDELWNEDGKMIVILDPMHNGQNTGGEFVYGGQTYYTSSVNYAIAAAMKEELEKYKDVEVLLTRGEEETATLANRQAFIKDNSEADFFITTWVDCSGNGSASGLHTDVYKKGSYDSTTEEIGQESMLVGERMQSMIEDFTDLSLSDTPIRKDYWAVTTAAQDAGIPNLYFCFGDLSSEEEFVTYWSDSEKIKEVGIAAAKGFASAYGLTRIDPYVIAIEAGWGDVTDNEIKEQIQDKNLEIANALKAKLENYQDVQVVMCRTEDMVLPLSDRVQLGIDAGADLYVALHTDLNTSDETVNGAQVYYHSGAGDDIPEWYGEESFKIASLFMEELTGIGFANNTLESADGWLITRKNAPLGILALDVEQGFFTNAGDYAILENTDLVAGAEADAIVKYFGLYEGKALESIEPTQPEEKPDYAKLAREDGILTIVLDPGHGGSESGAVYTWDDETYYEKNINLKIAQYLYSLLGEYKDLQVFMTHDTDKYVGLSERTEFGQENLADVLISLHNNASGTHTSHGSMVLVTSTHWQPESATVDDIYQVSEDLGLAFISKWTAMGLDLSGDLGTESNGLLRRLYPQDDGEVLYPNGDCKDYYAIVRNGLEAGIPSIILEHAYIDCESDFRNYLMTDEQLYELAKADCEAIVEYYGLEKKDAEATPTPEATPTSEVTPIPETTVEYESTIVTPTPTSTPGLSAGEQLAVLDRVTVEASVSTLYAGGTVENAVWIPMTLPEGLKKVAGFTEKELRAVKADEIPVTITYSSDHEEIATVNHVGRIKAIGEGTATITAEITLRSGVSRKYTVTVTVEKAEIKVITYSDTMTVGEKQQISVELKGLKESDLAWKTSKKARVMVSKNTGKTIITAYAKSVGTDEVIITAGKVTTSVNVTVNPKE